MVRGSALDDAETDLTYREHVARGAMRHREQIRMLFYGGTDHTRFVARMYLRGVRVPGTVVETEAQALRWLREHGF